LQWSLMVANTKLAMAAAPKIYATFNMLKVSMVACGVTSRTLQQGLAAHVIFPAVHVEIGHYVDALFVPPLCGKRLHRARNYSLGPSE